LGVRCGGGKQDCRGGKDRAEHFHGNGIADNCFNVIARSEATRQSILSCCGAMDCFAALAMAAARAGLTSLAFEERRERGDRFL
jgi:hypothetical protein